MGFWDRREKEDCWAQGMSDAILGSLYKPACWTCGVIRTPTILRQGKRWAERESSSPLWSVKVSFLELVLPSGNTTQDATVRHVYHFEFSSAHIKNVKNQVKLVLTYFMLPNASISNTLSFAHAININLFMRYFSFYCVVVYRTFRTGVHFAFQTTSIQTVHIWSHLWLTSISPSAF